MTDLEALSDTDVLWGLINAAEWRANNGPDTHYLVVESFLDMSPVLQERLLRLSLKDDGPLHGKLLQSVNLFSWEVEAFWGPTSVLGGNKTDKYPEWMWLTIAESPELRERASGARAEYSEEYKSWSFPDMYYPKNDPGANAASDLRSLAWWPYLKKNHEQVALSLQGFINDLCSRSHD